MRFWKGYHKVCVIREAEPILSKGAGATERWAVWLLRLLGAGFLVFGLLFAFAPEATLRYFASWGVPLGWPLPTEMPEGGLWRVLTVAYMAMVTVLAFWGSVRTPVQPALLGLLAFGKAASALTALLFYWTVQSQFLYLLNFVVDGSIALLVLLCRYWLRQVSE